MIGYITKLISSFLQTENNPNNDDFETQEEKILSEINAEELDAENLQINIASKPIGQSEPEPIDVEVFKCVRKTGRITFICDDYGIIDSLTYFEPSQVPVTLTLKENDEVSYTTYRLRDNETERVYRMHGLTNESWDSDVKPELADNDTDKDEEITALDRVITGRVIERRGREFFIEPSNIWCNLDEIETSYVPIEGDWVSLEASVSINKEAIDLTGDVLMVKSLKPLLKKTGCGRVTFWSNTDGVGSIENLIYFTRIICNDGYVPDLGDVVLYEAIESDQERHKWRALKVSPSRIIQKKIKSSNNIPNNLLCDKNGITIKPTSCTLEIELHKTKKIVFEVTNNSESEQILTKTKFNSSKERSQLVLKSPNLTDSFTIKPKDTIKYVFECRGKFLGLSKEIFVFYFTNFTIGKAFEINTIGSKEMNKMLNCKIDTVFKVTHEKKYVKNNLNTDTVLYGPKPWKPPKFTRGEKKGFYTVPDKLWTAVVGDSEFPKNKTESIKALEEYASYFKEDLNISHYTDRFHTLLYLEEIETKRNFRRYDISGTFLFRNGDFLVLVVPGLVEKRPSLIPGDKIILTQPWSDTNNVQHVGYIHDIRQKDVFVKFHGSFHDSYDESECDIIFEPNLVPLSRCHDAVNRSIKKLGTKWLFPSSVNEKPPQVVFEVCEESSAAVINTEHTKTFDQSQAEFDTSKVSEEKILWKNEDHNEGRKKLKWFNKDLNERQKLAVINVLKGHGRPLPYIIFGPPGTGKTITLVEVIMQIYHLIPESRLLITTPSNSSADLICERLIQFGGFKPGQLVRLIALYRAAEGNIPVKLIPYSAVVDIREDGGKFLNRISEKTDVRTFTASQLTGRHRITVGTCVCIGSLHYLGFPPGHFTHILVDEAGQASEPECLISATFQNVQNGQVVLAGDPQQLGPVCMSRIADTFGLGSSLLYRFVSSFPYVRDLDGFPETSGYDPRFITKLTVNYRSVPEILSLPSQMFYNSDLIPTVSQTEGVEADIIGRFNFEAEHREKPAAIIFHGILGMNFQESESPSWYNPHEIWQAVSYLRKCYTIGLTSADVGIVTPYAKQVQKLRYLLSELGLSIPKIGTVEDFQGQERYVIIVSTVRSSFHHVQTDIIHSLGFVASPRRLNVALTRARALMIILGNPVLLSNDPYWKNVLEYCVKNNSYTGCCLDGLFEN